MPIETSWSIENFVVLQKFSGKLNLDEFNDAGNVLNSFSRSRSNFHLIADFSQINQVPDNLQAVGETLRAAVSLSRVTWFVTIGSNDVAMNFAVQLMPYFSMLRHKHFRSHNEAFEFLSLMDASLPIPF